MKPIIRILHPEDAEAFVALRREALEGHPMSFGSSPADTRMLSVDYVRDFLARRESSVVFGLSAKGALLGMVGVDRMEQIKRMHKATIWAMYVSPSVRGHGYGRLLLGAAVRQACAWPGVEQVQLSVTGQSVQAHRLYVSAGFREWGREPKALLWDGKYADEIHLVLDAQSAHGDHPG